MKNKLTLKQLQQELETMNSKSISSLKLTPAQLKKINKKLAVPRISGQGTKSSKANLHFLDSYITNLYTKSSGLI